MTYYLFVLVCHSKQIEVKTYDLGYLGPMVVEVISIIILPSEVTVWVLKLEKLILIAFACRP